MGIMIGRAAYHQPRFLSELEQNLYDTDFRIDESAIFDRYVAYMATQLNQGVKLNILTKHLRCIVSAVGLVRGAIDRY